MNIDSLAQHFRGEILTPESAAYDAARRVWNGMIDRNPAVIARCSGAADVVAAVRFAVENDIYPAIRAGGHNVAGVAMVDGGLVIDVSAMRGIHVDPAARTATAQSGLTWAGFDRETALHGLATTGGVISTTGIAGLTLGGGVGWLASRCGLVCDNTLEYDIVTADAALLRVNEQQHPDLFWALKGGGGNFGVVTSIKYRMHPISTVISGLLLHPLPRGRDVLRFYRDLVTGGLPDDLTIYAGTTTTPDGMPVVDLIPTYCGGDLDAGEELLEPLRRFGPPVADMVARMPYVAAQQMFDAAAPYGIRSYWKSNFLNGLPDEAIDTFLEFAASRPSPRTFVMLENTHGAAGRVAPDATACIIRNDPFNLVVMSLWENAGEDPLHIDWTRRFYTAMRPWSAGRAYGNAMSEDDDGRVLEVYGQNYGRLCDVKQRYDPDNRFRRNMNIRPRAQSAQR
jgi:FAD/FMN-containing dehydrogenase